MLVGKIAVADDDGGDVDGRKPGDANPRSCAIGSDGPCHRGDSVQVARWQGDTPTDLAGYPPHEQTDEVAAEELDGAKAGLLLGYPASFERPGLVLNHLLQLVLFDLPDDYFQEMPARLSGVNLSEVHRMTSEHIQTDALRIIVVGDRETIEPGLNELGIPLVHLAADGSRL